MQELTKAALAMVSFILLAEVTTAQEIERYTKVANRLVERINAADYNAIDTMFNKEMSAALPLDKSSAFFKGLTEQMGRIERLDPPQSMPPAMIFPAHFERGLLDVQIRSEEHTSEL